MGEVSNITRRLNANYLMLSLSRCCLVSGHAVVLVRSPSPLEITDGAISLMFARRFLEL